MMKLIQQVKKLLNIKEIFLSKEKMLLRFIDLSALLVISYFIIFSLFHNGLQLFLLSLFLVPLFSLRFAVIKNVWGLRLSLHLLIGLIGIGFITPMIYFTGGLRSPITSWLLLPPLVSILLIGNNKSTKLWFGVVLLVLILFSILTQINYRFPNLIEEHLKTEHTLLSNIGLIISVFALALIAENWKNNVLLSLERTKLMLEKSSETARIGTWSIDFETRKLKCNKLAREIHGLKSNEELSIDEYIHFFHEKEAYLSLLERVKSSILNKEEKIDSEFQVLTKKKELVWVRIIGIPVFEEKECVGIYGLIQDINGRKSAEINLIKERQRLDYVIQGAKLGTWEWNIQTGEIIFNEQWASFIGYKPNEIFPCSADDLRNYIYPADAKRAEDAMTDYFNGTTDFYQCEMRMIHKEGHLIWLLVQGKVLTWTEDGKPQWMYGTHYENTKEKQLIEELTKSESYARSLIESIPDLLFVLTEEGTFLDYKAQDEDLYSQPGFFLGKNFRNVFPPELAQQIDKEISEAIRLNKLVEFNYSMTIQNTEKYYNARIVPVEHDKVVVLCRDETAKVLAEKELLTLNKKFKSIFDNCPIGIALADFETGRFIEVNKALLTFLGYSKEEMLSFTFKDLTPSEYDKQEQIRRDSLEKSGRFDHYEKESLSKGGKRIPIALNGVSITDELGRQLILSIVQDISAQKEYEISLKQAKEQAEIANNAKSEFLTNISHEIRTPLNAIIGFTDLLLKTPLGEAQREYMTTVFQSANVLLELINDILDLSKIEAGKLDLQVEEVNLRELSNQVVEILNYQALKKNINLRANLSSSLPKLVFGDILRLRQILFNLLSNAIKFTEEGIVELKIEVLETQTDKQLQKFRFSVIDTGIGIALENQQKIFEAFTQENPTAVKKYGGTGLGLTISNRLLALMGSKLALESKQGEGSTFYFDLTLKPNLSDADNKTRELYEEEGLSGRRRPKPSSSTDGSILIVEDNAANMLLMKSYFNNIIPGVRLLEAENGEIALRLFKEFKPKLVITDIQMPKLNGYELTTRIRNLTFGKQVPIIAITAGILNGEREKCLELGMNDYLSKPVLQETLRHVLEKWLAEDLEKYSLVLRTEPNVFKHVNERLARILEIKLEDANEIIEVAKESLKETSIELDTYINQEDLSAIKHSAHKVRGTALMFGFPILYKAAFEVETDSSVSLHYYLPLIKKLKEELSLVINNI
jgi:PAS domain S-box-containing protein